MKPQEIFKLLLHLTISVQATYQSQLGSCWTRVSSERLCQGYWRSGITKEACCRASQGNNYGNGWTPNARMSAHEIFYWNILEEGAPQCQACRVSCDGVQCGSERRCRMKNGVPRCVCAPNCSQNRGSEHGQGPVCASDGRSHRNLCSLRKFNCRKRRTEWVDYAGVCRYSCDDVTCPAGKRCVLDQNAQPHCLTCSLGPCPHVSDTSRHLCGVDGVTYPSVCHMMAYTCRTSIPVALAYPGPCQSGATCSSIQCPNGKTCLTDPVSGRIKCERCSSHCPSSMGDHAICGNDNVTYSNWCELHNTACAQRRLIETSHFGRCGHMPTAGALYSPDDEDDSDEN